MKRSEVTRPGRLARIVGLSLAVSLTVLAPACKKSPPVATATGPAPLAKRVSLSWGIQQAGNKAEIFLASTDERGAQVSHPLGTFEGTCAPVKAAPEMGALTAIACTTGGTGIELHAVDRSDRILIMKLRTDSGVASDPMNREQIAEIAVPLGTKIEAAL